MSKKIKILLAVTAAVVVLTVGGGVAVIASGTTTTPTTTTQSNPLLAKVAAILGNVTEQQLVDTFKQAREQVSQETITTLLAKAVESGTITAAEKTAIETWLAQKPDGTHKEAMKAWMEKKPTIEKERFINSLLRAPGRIKDIMPIIASDAVIKKVAAILNIDEQKLIDAFKKAATELRSENFLPALDKAVANGKITQAEADQIESWWAQRPAALDKLAPGVGTGMWGRIKGGIMRFQQRLSGATAR